MSFFPLGLTALGLAPGADGGKLDETSQADEIHLRGRHDATSSSSSSPLPSAGQRAPLSLFWIWCPQTVQPPPWAPSLGTKPMLSLAAQHLWPPECWRPCLLLLQKASLTPHALPRTQSQRILGSEIHSSLVMCRSGNSRKS